MGIPIIDLFCYTKAGTQFEGNLGEILVLVSEI